MNHVPTDQCNRNYGGSVQDDIMFCAGVDGGGFDSCQVCYMKDISLF